MSENRNISILVTDIINQESVKRPDVVVADSSDFEVPDVAREDADVYIATAFAHDEHIRRSYERSSAYIWSAKNNDMNGRQVMLLKFAEIDSSFAELEPAIELNIQVSDEPIFSSAVKVELALLFDKIDKQEAVKETERARIDAEKTQSLTAAREFLLRGLVVCVPAREHRTFDPTVF